MQLRYALLGRTYLSYQDTRNTQTRIKSASTDNQF